MTQKKKVITSIVLFALIFAGLLTAATFFDLQISMILTKNALSAHTYYTNHTFGAGFEAIGCAPMCLSLSFAFQILFRFFMRKKNLSNALRYILSAAALIGTVITIYIPINDIIGYLLRHLEREDAAGDGYITIAVSFVTALLSFCSVMAVKNFSDNQIEKLFGFALGVIAIAAVSTIIVELIKSPAGRIRFRAMNMYPESKDYGFAAFAKWYEFKGQWLDRETKIALFGTSDALRSFPSGHTSQAGCTYSLIMLPDALGIKNKKARAIFWLLPIAFTGTVAVSRIIVGAHFFSDVLIGGTLSFVCTIIAREVFVLKGRNVKALGTRH